MAIFNSYVKLPEGIIFFFEDPAQLNIVNEGLSIQGWYHTWKRHKQH